MINLMIIASNSISVFYSSNAIGASSNQFNNSVACGNHL